MQIDTTATHVRTWRDGLSRFQTEASTQGFVDYVTAPIQAGVQIPVFQFAPLYGYVVNARLIDAYLLAAVQAPPDQVEGALNEVRRAAQNVRYDHRAPKSLSREARELYEPITSRTAAEVRELGTLLFDVFMRYVRDEIESGVTADDVLREACQLSLSGNDKSAIRRVGTAGARMLLGSPMWRGWQDEGSDVFRRYAFLLYSAFESCQNVLPLARVAEQRQKADEFAQQYHWAPDRPERKKTGAQVISKAPDTPSKTEIEQITRLLKIADRDTPWTDEEIRASAAEREQQISRAKDILYSVVPLPESLEAHIKSLAIRALGILRCDDAEVIEHFTHLIVEAEQEAEDSGIDDEDFDASELTDVIVQALQRIGAPAVPVCLTFLRNSFHTEACFDVARALGAAGRGSNDVFEYLLDRFEQAAPDEGKARWAMPLALTHDARAVAPLARGLEATLAEEDEFVREFEAYDYLDALDELGAIEAFITPPTSSSPETDITWASVEVRGVGLIESIAPTDWAPPAERAEEGGGDEDEEWFDAENMGDEDLSLNERGRSPFEFEPPAPPRPFVNTAKVGRNDPCPCGSGKKYKHCHGKQQ